MSNDPKYPERIWAGTDADFTQRWRTNDERGCTEYLRADIAEEALAALKETADALQMQMEGEGFDPEHCDSPLLDRIDAILARATNGGRDDG